MGPGSNDDSSNNDWFGPTSDIVNKVLADVLVRNEGSIFLFTPTTPAAREWISENVQPNTQWFGASLVVEHRYAADLAVGMRADGLVLA
jgi:hypothetical protein